MEYSERGRVDLRGHSPGECMRLCYLFTRGSCERKASFACSSSVGPLMSVNIEIERAPPFTYSVLDFEPHLVVTGVHLLRRIISGALVINTGALAYRMPTFPSNLWKICSKPVYAFTNKGKSLCFNSLRPDDNTRKTRTHGWIGPTPQYFSSGEPEGTKIKNEYIE